MRLDCTSVCFFSQQSVQSAVSPDIFCKSPSASSVCPMISFLSYVLNLFSQSQTTSLTFFLNRKLNKGFMTDSLVQNMQKFPICSPFMIQFSDLGWTQCWVDSWTSNLKRFQPNLIILWFHYTDIRITWLGSILKNIFSLQLEREMLWRSQGSFGAQITLYIQAPWKEALPILANAPEFGVLQILQSRKWELRNNQDIYYTIQKKKTSKQYFLNFFSQNTKQKH